MKRIAICMIVSFAFGTLFGTLFFSDYDLLANYYSNEVRLRGAISVENAAGQRINLPPSTVLFHKKSYMEEDHLFIEVIVQDIEGLSSDVADAKGQSIYYLNPPTIDEEKISELEDIALRVYNAIIARDISVILGLIDRKGGIAWGPDGSKTYGEVEEDLRSHKGPLYCLLFGCPGYKEKAVRDFFAEVKRDQLHIEVRVLDHYGPEYADVIYHWPGKPPDLWVSDLPNPLFRLESHGWKFEKVFME
ncbi:MAG: hypothetical protein ACE5JQ_03550 [Candidatus Methylomirabilales bacterium]